MLFADGATWGETCQRLQAAEIETSGLKADIQEIRVEMQAQMVGIETRLRTVEMATQAIPSMAQDIRDIRDYLLTDARGGGQ
jgi:hypothetical protein